ncbi:MAG: recombinase family protein, partial [Oscillospiraceae bacterium]|nr:recombinase family protein [Oscillospiraceae bacterium]
MAIAYYRFSSHSQNEASIDQQREAAQKLAAAKGYTIIKEYEDRAISGTTEERPGFQLMLSEVAKIRPAALIMWKTDRLGRDRYTLAMAKKTIRDAGCQILLVAEAVPEDSPEASLMEGLLESMAEFYSKQLRQNITRGMRYNAENGLYNGHK